MPIRINLLAEQQAADEARRKDPVKRALWIGSLLVFATVVWTLMLWAELKAKRAEQANLAADFAKVDEAAKAVRNMQAEAGTLRRRVASLEKYSTNRILWGNMLDAMQKVTMEQIRVKSITFNQNYRANAATNFVSTNVYVPLSAPPAFWKFWAKSQAQDTMTVASNMVRGITNSYAFVTNKLPVTSKMEVVSTNRFENNLTVKADYTLPAVAVEDIDILISAGDYGNPPGGNVDNYTKTLGTVSYFAERLTKDDNRIRFTERPTNPQADMTDPGNPVSHLPFSVRLKFEPRVITNE